MTKKPPRQEEEQRIRSLSKNIAEHDRSEETPEAADGKLKQEELVNLFDLSIDMLCVADINGCFKSINKAWETTLGYKEEELLSRPYVDFVHPDDAAATVAEGEKLLQGQSTVDFENRYRCKDGSYKWLAWTATAGAENGVTFSVARDITNRKWAEQALERAHENLERKVEERTAELVEANRRLEEKIVDHRRAEEALRSEKEFTEIALNSQQDTYFLFEPATGRAIRWNRSFSDITGYTNEEIAGLVAPDSYYSPRDLERAVIFIQKVQGKGIGTIELELVCKDGRKVPTEYKVSSIKDEKGKPKYLVSIGRDLTERRRMEEEIARVQKLESLGILAGGIAHDFNNILAAILTGISMVRMYGNLEDDMFQILTDAEAASVRARMLTQQLLTFASGGAPIKRPASVSALIRDTSRFSLSGSNVKLFHSRPCRRR